MNLNPERIVMSDDNNQIYNRGKDDLLLVVSMQVGLQPIQGGVLAPKKNRLKSKYRGWRPKPI
jgi:hypothetical protein